MEINNAIDKICEKFGIIVDWTQQNVQPYMTDLCERVCKYEIATNIITISTLLFVGIVLLLLFKWFLPMYKKEVKKHYYNQNDFIVISFWVFVMCLSFYIGVIIFVIPSHIRNIIEVIYLPEKAVLDMINSYL